MTAVDLLQPMEGPRLFAQTLLGSSPGHPLLSPFPGLFHLRHDPAPLGERIRGSRAVVDRGGGWHLAVYRNNPAPP